MKRIIERIAYSDDLSSGTFNYIKNLEKAGFLKIVEILKFEEHDDFDDMENLDYYWESLELVIDYGTVQDSSGFMYDILRGLGMEFKTVTKFEL